MRHIEMFWTMRFLFFIEIEKNNYKKRCHHGDVCFYGGEKVNSDLEEYYIFNEMFRRNYERNHHCTRL